MITQTVNFISPSSPVTFSLGQEITLQATASSGLPVSFSLDPSSTGSASFNGSMMVVTAAGNIVINADQAGNSFFSAAQRVQQNIFVNKSAQSIAFTQPTGGTFYPGKVVSLSGPASSGLPVIFSINPSSTGAGFISGSKLVVTGAGTFVIDANQSGNGNFSAASNQNSVVIAKAAQAITFAAPSSPIQFAAGQQVVLNATSNSTLPVSVTIGLNSTGMGSINGNILAITEPGTFYLNANQPGNGNYLSATQVQQILVVNPAALTSQTINFQPLTSPITFLAGQQVNLVATASSGLPVTFSIDSSSTGSASIQGATLTINGPGTIVVDANQSGNSAYAAAPQVQNNLVVNPGQVVNLPVVKTNYLSIPNFGYAPTITSIASGNWSSPSVWSLGRVPASGDIVAVNPGTSVVYDVNDSTNGTVLNTVQVQPGGTLSFSTVANTHMCVCNVMVLQGGTLNLGTQTNPVPPNVIATIIVANVPINTTIDPAQFGHGLIVLGNFNAYGAIKSTYGSFAQEPLAGANKLILSSPVVGWQAGDSLKIPDTRQLNSGVTDGSNYVGQNETVTIQSVSADGKTVTLTSALQFNHYGARNDQGGLDYLAHALNMNRNVSIISQDINGSRGCVIFTGYANINVNYMVFGGMGRTTYNKIDNTTFDSNGKATHIGTNQADRNPVNFLNLIGPPTPQANGYQFTFNGNLISCPLYPMPYIWGISLINSHYGLIVNNGVCNWKGSGISVDNVSVGNKIAGNFVMAITGTAQRMDQNLQGVGYWLGNPCNYVDGNIACNINCSGPGVMSYGFDIDASGGGPGSGAGGVGYVPVPLVQGNDPILLGQFNMVNMNNEPIMSFTNNITYASQGGVTWWYINTDGSGNLFPNSQVSTILNCVAWHVTWRGLYGYNCSNFVIDGFQVRGDFDQINNAYAITCGMHFDDYVQNNMTIQNCNIQGMNGGIHAPTMVAWNTSTMVTTVVQNCYLDCIININVSPMRNTASSTNIAPQTINIVNVQFANPAGVPQDWCWNVRMEYLTQDSIGTSVMNVAEIVNVKNYNNQGKNFQVFYSQTPSPTDTPAGSGTVPSGLTTMPFIGGKVLAK